MKPYSDERKTKGLAGCRKSYSSTHRKRSLRVDKRSARQQSHKIINEEVDEHEYEYEYDYEYDLFVQWWNSF